MPKKPMDYSKTHFYKIVCNDTDLNLCYVGHTTDFKRRKYEHKSCCDNVNGKMYNHNVYKTIRENGGFENWSMILLDTLHCENSLDAKKKEREFMEELNATLNQVYPSRSSKERYETNKEIVNEKHREYYRQNKEKHKQRQKKYDEENKEYLQQKKKEYYENNKDVLSEKAKEYRKNNKELVQEGKKKYYQEHRDEILKKCHEHYLNNIEKKKEYDKIYREQNKERKRENDRLYREKK